MNTNDHAPWSEVEILERMVAANLSEPHTFRCVAQSDLPGWWGKVRLFEMSKERNLWLDLDVVITGSLDNLVTPTNNLRIAKNWANSGYGGCQSSVMYWEGDAHKTISAEFDPAIAYWPPRNDPGVLWGDQEWITQLRDEGRVQVEYFNQDEVVSYKYHCRGKAVPKGAKVVVFHGKPNPSEVTEKWVNNARYPC